MSRFPWSALTAALLTGAAPAAGSGPRWTADGALIRPDSVDRWITVGTSLGLGYTDPTSAGAGRFQPLFHRVYLEPRAYQAARRSGGGQPVRLRAVGLVRDLPDSGNVSAFRRDDSNLQRSPDHGARAKDFDHRGSKAAGPCR